MARSRSRQVIECPACGRVSSSDGLYCDRCGKMGIVPTGSTYAGRYQIKRLVAEGGMGRIYKAIDQGRRRTAAIKECLDKKDRGAQERQLYVETFKREAEILRELRIVRAVPQLLEDVRQWNGRHFFVMEFIEGDNLLDVMQKRNKPFEWEMVVEWSSRLCQVIHVLHSHKPDPIIYRDLKLENIVFRTAGRHDEDIVLLDFGIARQAYTGRKITRFAGSDGYAPFEQSKLGKPETRSDLYSLAVCMHQLLTGRDPTDNPPPFPAARQLNPRVPQWLSDLIDINLSEEPRERYESADEMREDLRQQRVTSTLRCGKCGTENERSLIYCRQCAMMLLTTPRPCRHCADFIPANSRYCPRCGKEV